MYGQRPYGIVLNINYNRSRNPMLFYDCLYCDILSGSSNGYPLGSLYKKPLIDWLYNDKMRKFYVLKISLRRRWEYRFKQLLYITLFHHMIA